MRNIRIDICYDGTRYRGWQRLSGVENTIQGKLEQTLTRILGEPIEITGSGRTDAGVHAMGQVANFHCSSPMPTEEILSQIRRYLPENIGIYSCREARRPVSRPAERQGPTVTESGTTMDPAYSSAGS